MPIWSTPYQMSSSSTVIQISLIKNSPRSRFWQLLTQQWKTCSNINSNQWARPHLHTVLLWSKEEAAKRRSLYTFRTDYFWTSLDIIFRLALKYGSSLEKDKCFCEATVMAQTHCLLSASRVDNTQSPPQSLFTNDKSPCRFVALKFHQEDHKASEDSLKRNVK